MKPLRILKFTLHRDQENQVGQQSCHQPHSHVVPVHLAPGPLPGSDENLENHVILSESVDLFKSFGNSQQQ